MFTRDVKIFMFVIFARHTKRGASQRKLKVLHDSAFNCHSKNMFQHIFESQRHAINNKSEPPLISGEKHKMQNSFEIYLSTARRPADIVQKTPFFHHHENLLMNFFTFFAPERNEKEMKKRSFDEEKGTSTCYRSSIQCTSTFLWNTCFMLLFVLLKNQFLKPSFHRLCLSCENSKNLPTIDKFTWAQNSFEAWKRNQKEKRMRWSISWREMLVEQRLDVKGKWHQRA